jgi:hypothetical protein
MLCNARNNFQPILDELKREPEKEKYSPTKVKQPNKDTHGFKNAKEARENQLWVH